MKWKRFWMIGAIIAVVAVLGGGFWFFRANGGPEIVFAKVERGELSRTVEASGELQSIDKANLSFATSGIVKAKSVKIGGKVKAGDVLVSLEAVQEEADIARANQQLAIAEANLGLALEGARSETVAISFASLDATKAARDVAEVDLENTILLMAANVAEADITLQNAERDLENAREKNEVNMREAREDYVSALKAAVIEVRNAIAKADEVLGIENQLINVDYEDLLAITDTAALNNANAAFTLAAEARNASELSVYALPFEPTDAQITSASVRLEDALTKTSTLLLYTRQVLDATTLDTADFTFTELLALKAKIDTARDAIQTDESAVLSAKQSYLASAINAKTAEDAALKAFDLAQISRTKAIANETASVRIAQATLEQREAEVRRAEATLAELEADPRMNELAVLRAEVTRAKADYDAANDRLRRMQIVSPLDGIVTSLDVNVGEQVNAGSPVAVVEATGEEQFHIVLNVSESDIARITVLDEAIITFDAYGDAVEVRGEVLEINPAASTVEGVVFYEVKVFLRSGFEEITLRPGMSADIVITTDHVSDALFIPRRAVLTAQNGKSFVRIKAGKGYEEREVITGLIGDEGRIQIVSGLTEGEEIILTIRE